MSRFKATLAAVWGVLAVLASCSPAEDEPAREAHEDEATGPHGGRLLEGEGLTLEVQIFEGVAEPELRVYAYDDGALLNPAEIQATVALTRLGGHVDRYALAPQGDHLASDRGVDEPHSFDVVVSASRGARTYEWSYASYEGRTTIRQAAADRAGIEVASAAPATLEQTVDLTGRIALRPEARAEVRARYRGPVLEVRKTVGDQVSAGELLARIEAADSLRTYDVTSPIAGVVLDRTTNVGDVAGDGPLFVVADLTRLQAELHVFPRDVASIRPGEPVRIESLEGVATAESTIASFLPTAEADTQTLIARAFIENDDGAFRPGMTVRGRATVGRRQAAVAVAADAVQRWRNFDVVFTRMGDVYEARPVILGARGDGLVEILDGLEAGEPYVSSNSFLVRADIEKSGAAHEH